MNIYKATGLSFLATCLKLVAAFILNKIISVYIGPSGLAMVGQLQSALQIIYSLAKGGFNAGVTKYIAEYTSEIDRQLGVISTAAKLTALATLITSAVVYTNAENLSILIFGIADYQNLFFVVAASTYFFVLNNFILSVLNGYKRVGQWAVINICQSVIATVYSTVLIVNFGLTGALFSLITIPILVSLVALLIAAKCHETRAFSPKLPVRVVDLRRLGKFALMTLTSTVAVPITHILVRSEIVDAEGWDSAGIWQGIWSFSTMYLSVITATLSVYLLPRLSELGTDPRAFKEVYRLLGLTVPPLIVLSILIYLFKDLVIRILFDQGFEAMRELFPWQLIGNVLKVIGWIVGYIMIANAMASRYILFEIFFNIAFVLFSTYFLSIFGVVGVTYAYALNYLLYLGAVCLIMFSFVQCNSRQ